MKPDMSGLSELEINLATRVSVGDALTRSARMFGARAAVLDRGTTVTYRDLDTAAESVGRALLDAGLERQQPVAMLMGNSWQFLATYFGCAKAGLVAMPVNLVPAPWTGRSKSSSTTATPRSVSTPRARPRDPRAS